MKTTLQVIALMLVSPLLIAGALLFLICWLPCVLIEFGMDIFDK